MLIDSDSEDDDEVKPSKRLKRRKGRAPIVASDDIDVFSSDDESKPARKIKKKTARKHQKQDVESSSDDDMMDAALTDDDDLVGSDVVRCAPFRLGLGLIIVIHVLASVGCPRGLPSEKGRSREQAC